MPHIISRQRLWAMYDYVLPHNRYGNDRHGKYGEPSPRCAHDHLDHMIFRNLQNSKEVCPG
jgi:hypothetical protein